MKVLKKKQLSKKKELITWEKDDLLSGLTMAQGYYTLCKDEKCNEREISIPHVIIEMRKIKSIEKSNNKTLVDSLDSYLINTRKLGELN